MIMLSSILIYQTALFTCVAVIGALVARARYEASPGLTALLYPCVVLFLAGLSEELALLAPVFGLDSAFPSEVSRVLRLCNGLAWFLLCHSHLKLHGLLGWRHHLTKPVIALTLVFVLAYLVSIHKEWQSTVLSIGQAWMSITALYAAISAILVLRKNIQLWPSSLAGLRMAVFGLVVYPVVILAERLGYTYPFIDPERSVYEQLFPFFLLGISILAMPAFLTKSKGLLSEPGDARAVLSLSKREREIALLLREGRSHKEIALDLSLAISTVKSHTNGIYHKLGVTNRTELSKINLNLEDFSATTEKKPL